DGIRDFHVTGVQTCALPIFDIRITREGLNPGVHDAGLSLARLLLPRMDGSIEVSPQTPGERDGEHAATRGDTLVLRLPSAPIERSEERRVGKEASSWRCAAD